MTVGIWSGKPTFHAAARRTAGRTSDFAGRRTYGGCLGGVRSTGVGVSLPEKVWPTTTVSIAPLARTRSAELRGMGLTSAELNRPERARAASSAFVLPW